MSEAEKGPVRRMHPVRRRVAIVAGALVALFVLSVLVLTFVFSSVGREVIPPVVGELTDGGAAAAAGIEAGDRIVSVDGYAVESFADISKILAFNYGSPVDIVVDRNGATETYSVVPRLLRGGPAGVAFNRPVLGIAAAVDPTEGPTVRTYPLFEAFGRAVDLVVHNVKTVAVLAARLTIYLILPFIFVLALIVFVHELGHFLVARWCGVTVVTFSIGFGRELVGFTDRKGTRWRLSAIPLGGYVKFLGDENAASASSPESLAAVPIEQRGRTLQAQSVGKRAAIVAAGPVANFILGIAIFTFMFAVVGRTIMPPVVDQLTEGGAAAAAGIEAGDRLVSVDGRAIESFGDVSRVLTFNDGSPVEVIVNRGGTDLSFTITPQLVRDIDPLGSPYNRAVLGIQNNAEPGEDVVRTYSLFASVGRAFDEVAYQLSTTVTYIGRIITGRESIEQLGGPVSVARAAELAASISFSMLLTLAAGVSIGIGFVNLLPIPLLDGGHLLFYAIEAVRRRPMGERAQEIGLRIGMACILLLMLVAFRNDIVRLFSPAT
ncbi:MAG: site-2 protease family protein [Bauldia sp.]